MSNDQGLSGAALVELFQRARSAHPNFAVDEAAFLLHLSACARSAAGFSTRHTEDLYLAFACGKWDREAMAHFEARYLSQVGLFIAHIRQHSSWVDEVRQRLRERMLVGVGPVGERRPSILGYRGSGPLGGWLRVASVRESLDLMEKERGRESLQDEAEDNLLAATVDPELLAIRQRHLPQVREAFRTALRSLDAGRRSLLRFHLIDGLNIGSIGKILGTSRASVGRMVVQCRQLLLEETRRNLAAMTGASADEVRSLIRLLQSQLDMSIVGILDNRSQSARLGDGGR